MGIYLINESPRLKEESLDFYVKEFRKRKEIHGTMREQVGS